MKMFLLFYVSFFFISCSESSFNSGSKTTRSNIPSANGATEKVQYEFTGANTTDYQADIIFLFDGSPSMSSTISQTLSNLNSLISNYLMKVQGFDYQLIIAGEVMDNLNGPNIGKVIVGIGSNGALSVAKQIIEGKLPVVGGKGAIRPSSVKELVVVTDDNASESMADFHAWMDQNPNIASNVHVNGIIALQRKCGGLLPDLFPTGEIGRTYIDLAGNPKTRGALGDLCTQGSWQPIFDSLGASLSQKKTANSATFQLAVPPTNPESIEVLKNGQPLNKSSVQYNSATNQLTILIATLPTDKITVLY